MGNVLLCLHLNISLGVYKSLESREGVIIKLSEFLA